MLRYLILCDGETIGSSDLEERDDSLGVAAGRFEPTAAYARVQPVFRLFIEARADGESEPVPGKLAAYEREREKLVVTIQERGGKLMAQSGVVVLDYSAQPGEAGEDAIWVEVYFSTPRAFAQLG